MGKLFGGSKGPSQAELDAQAAQQKELADLKSQEESKKAAAKRRRKGRASLVATSETGIKSDTLG
jgi:hypothetical protein